MKKIIIFGMILLLLATMVAAQDKQRMRIQLNDGSIGQGFEARLTDNINYEDIRLGNSVNDNMFYILPVDDNDTDTSKLTLDEKSKINLKLSNMQKNVDKVKELKKLSCEDKCYFKAEQNILDQTELEQVEEVKFLGFKLNAKHKFTVNEDGVIQKETRNWVHYFYNWGLAKKLTTEVQE